MRKMNEVLCGLAVIVGLVIWSGGSVASADASMPVYDAEPVTVCVDVDQDGEDECWLAYVKCLPDCGSGFCCEVQ